MRSVIGPRLIWMSVALWVVLAVFGVVATETADSLSLEDDSSSAAFLVAGLAAVVTGAVVAVRKPKHPVGWMLLTFGVSGAVGRACFGLAAMLADAGMDTAAAWFEGVSVALYTAGFLLILAAVLLFPNGDLPSPRWRPVGWAMALAAGTGFFAALLNGGFGGDAEVAIFGPVVSGSYADVADGVSGLFFLFLVLSALGAVAALVFRFRRSSGEEHQQMKWVAAAALFLALTIAVVILEVGAAQATGWVEVLMAAGLASIPTAMGFAILKYRLYDIDIVINKAVVFGALAAFIASVYIGIVAGLGSMFGDNVGLSIAATAVVALLFQPARRWVQRWANRLVYGERASPYEVLARFSRRSSELSDEELLLRIPRLIVDGTGASAASLWVRSSDGFRTAASWPEDAGIRRVARDEEFEDPEADYSRPVFHDGELLGGISLVKAGGDAVTPTEEVLLGDLAAGMGLALRNARLTGQLRRQVAELEASRERVLAAADAARRALENDLDSGPQQQLVALKVKLGPTRKRAEQLGEEKLAGVLGQLEEDAGDAIKAVRDFAGGIYPPLLEAEGLAAAITQQTHKAAIPISVHSDGAGRYLRETEAAVYFTILEALQNTAKYAEARSASVALTVNGNRLLFEVRDDGRGFDSTSVDAGAGLAGMADRLDTVGGEVRIESTPGEGTVVTGSVPIQELVSVGRP